MIETFAEFIKQYNSTGSKKADGYDESHFRGLSELEKQKVYDLLLAEVPVSPMVVEWMYKLFPKRAIDDSTSYLSSVDLTKASWVFVVQYFLYQKTDEKAKYQNGMINLYPMVEDREKSPLVRYITKTENSKSLVDFLKMIIFTSNDKESSFYAAERFLNAHGLAYKKGQVGEYENFKSVLSDINLAASVKISVIEKVESSYPLLLNS